MLGGDGEGGVGKVSCVIDTELLHGRAAVLGHAIDRAGGGIAKSYRERFEPTAWPTSYLEPPPNPILLSSMAVTCVCVDR
jgi:hypothetical protein